MVYTCFCFLTTGTINIVSSILLKEFPLCVTWLVKVECTLFYLTTWKAFPTLGGEKAFGLHRMFHRVRFVYYLKYPVTQTEYPVLSLSLFLKRRLTTVCFKTKCWYLLLKKLGNTFSLLANTLKFSVQPVLLLGFAWSELAIMWLATGQGSLCNASFRTGVLSITWFQRPVSLYEFG